MSHLHHLSTLSTQQALHLDETYTTLLDRLAELKSTITRYHELSRLANSLLEEFDSNDEKFKADMKAQVSVLEQFRAEIGAIQYLQKKLETQREMVEVYKERLERVGERIERQRQMEVLWRQRASSMMGFSSHYYPWGLRFFFFLFRETSNPLGLHFHCRHHLATCNVYVRL